jgi:D-threonate/D-erythronate kinase
MLVMNSCIGTPLVIADDLTGATEVALALADVGLGNLAWLWKDEGSPPDGHVCSVNLDTRDLQADEACLRLAEFFCRCQDLRFRTIFKKVDSTARRHIAAEIDVCLRSPEFDAVVVALAAPDDQRNTLNGIHRVGNIPVDQTPFARDLALPTAHLPTLLTAGTTRTCLHVPMATIRKGVDAISAAIAFPQDAERPIISMDCETRDDLHSIALAIIQSSKRILPIGSAAMFRELIGISTNPLSPRWIGFAKTPVIDVLSTYPILVVCGSLQPVTRRQIKRLLSESSVVAVEHVEACECANAEILVKAIEQGRIAVISTPELRENQENSESRIASLIASLVQTVLVRKRPKGLIVVGGNTSNAVINKLGAEGLRILDRLSPVVPVLEIVGGPFCGLPIITKGGGVGAEDILIDAVAALQRISTERFIPEETFKSGTPVI